MSVDTSDAGSKALAAFKAASAPEPHAPAISSQNATVERTGRVLLLSTLGFTLLFAVWLMFGVLGLAIRTELGLSDVQFGWLTAAAILNGSVWRLLFGMLAARWGGRRLFVAILLASAVPCLLVSRANSFAELLCYAFLVGIAGNAFVVGVAWISSVSSRERQGTALGIFGAGNVGASVTKIIGPAIIGVVPATGYLGGAIPGGWRFIPTLYAALLVVMAAATWAFTPKDDDRTKSAKSLTQMLTPLREARVWRFSLYYVVVFGAYVALSAWLPKYYVDVYQLTLSRAAMLTSVFIFPASLLRPLGGYLSDRFGPRVVMYWVFGALLATTAPLCIPSGTLGFRTGVFSFTVLVALTGVCMGIGKAAVYKYIPDYFPGTVGAVGGLVGALGALGGFFLPLGFAYLQRWTKLPEMTFIALFAVTAVSFGWLHLTVVRMRQRAKALEPAEELP